MTNVDILKEVMATIDKPHKWCRGYPAINNKGKIVSMLDRQACRFCLSGAINKVLYDNSLQENKRNEMWSLMNREVRTIEGYENYYASFVEYNDNSTHKNIMKLIRKVIKSEKQKQNK